jgi:predicted protein tyrosine phosphatase
VSPRIKQDHLFDNWDDKWKAKSVGIDPSPGRNHLTEEVIVWADLILAMQAEHKHFISAHFRNDLDKVKVLDISDMYQRGDPQLIRSLVRELNREGVTVFLTTHYIDEPDQMCDRVAIIRQGKIAVEGSPERLKSSLQGEHIVEVAFDRDAAGVEMFLRGAIVLSGAQIANPFLF